MNAIGKMLNTRLLVPLALLALVLGPTIAAAQRLPAEVCVTLTTERAKYGAAPTSAELAKILNATAWVHRADTWGLSAKPAGTRCPGPGGQDMACDILHRRSDNLIWDVLVAAGEAAIPSCVGTLGPMTDPDRPWMAPTDPGGAPPTPPAPPPPDDLVAIKAELVALHTHLVTFAVPLDQASAESLNAARRALEIQAALREVDTTLGAVAKSLEEHRAEGRKVLAWAKDWKTWASVIGTAVAVWVAK